MRTTALAAVAVAAAAAFHLPAAFAADPCSLLSSPEVSALLGQTGAKGVAAGPEKDEDSGGQVSYCTFRPSAAPTSAVIVSVVEFRSDAEARTQLTKNLVLARMDDENAKVSEEPGIGERSFYAASKSGSMFVFLKKNRVVGVAIGGSRPGKAGASKESLLKAAQSAASKV